MTAFADVRCAGSYKNNSQGGVAAISKRYENGLDRLRRNNFNTERTLQEYRADFGGQLFGILKSLSRADQTWIDMGAGSANAQVRFLKTRLKSFDLNSIPRLIPISYAIPRWSVTAIRKIESQFPETFQYIEGIQTPDSIRKLPPADLITDNVGIVQYADSVGLKSIEFVEAYLDVLKPGGYLLISPFSHQLLSTLSRRHIAELEIATIISIEDTTPFLLIKKKP